MNTQPNQLRTLIQSAGAARLGAAAAVMTLIGVITPGCAHTSTSQPAAAEPTAAAPSPAIEREAREFLERDLREHWVQTKDGWLARVSDAATPKFEMRRRLEIASVTAQPLTEADTLNGYTWRGFATLAPSPTKVARYLRAGEEPSWRNWEQGDESAHPIKIQLGKLNGKWEAPSDWMNKKPDGPPDTTPPWTRKASRNLPTAAEIEQLTK